MTKWINAKRNEKQKVTILSKLDRQHKTSVLQNRQYLKVIIECLMFTAQQNLAQRCHSEERDNVREMCDINRATFWNFCILGAKIYHGLTMFSKSSCKSILSGHHRVSRMSFSPYWQTMYFSVSCMMSRRVASLLLLRMR